MTEKRRVGKWIDRHALLAMTYMVDYVTARRLHANVAVQTLTVS